MGPFSSTPSFILLFIATSLLGTVLAIMGWWQIGAVIAASGGILLLFNWLVASSVSRASRRRVEDVRTIRKAEEREER